MSKQMPSQSKTKEQKMIFSKLLIVEIEWKNVICHTMQLMKKKELQREYLSEKYRIKEIDLKMLLLTAPCVRKKGNAKN